MRMHYKHGFSHTILLILRYFFILLLIIFCFSQLLLHANAKYTYKTVIHIYKTADGKVMYQMTELNDEYEELSSNIELADTYFDKYHIVFYEPLDINIYLLENGIGKLKNPDIASQEEIDAQNRAIEASIGLWEVPEEKAPTPENDKSPDESGLETFLMRISESPIWDKIKALLAEYKKELFSITMVITILSAICNMYYRRKIVTIFYGMPASGKTALTYRLFHTNDVSEGDIRNLGPTTFNETIQTEKLVRGKYTLIPVVTDVPGNDLVSALDKGHIFMRRVFVFVVAPTQELDSDTLSEEFMSAQLERLTTIMLFTLNSKKYRWRRPRKLILFFNKTDVQPPKQYETYADMFRQTFCALNRGIPTTILAGSALKGEGISKLKNEIFQVEIEKRSRNR